MDEKQKQQEMMFKFAMYEQQIQQLQQQLQRVEEAIIEMNNLKLELDYLIGKKGGDIFASIGRGIFAKAKLESEELVVNVGGRNFVTKSIEGTKEMISKQIEKLYEAKDELERSLENISREVEKVMREERG